MRFSKPATWVLSLLFIVMLPLAQAALAKDPAENRFPSLDKYESCYLLYDLNQQTYLDNSNQALASKRLSPCSTYKVPHALIGLDLGILKDGDTLFKWDGKPMYFTVWEKDHTLDSAMENSVVWYFQKLANQIGQARMKEYLAKFGYGNQDISGGLQKFWLMSSLKISPKEQIKFLEKLVRNALPVSQHAMNTTKKALIQGKRGAATLYGKTGSGVIKGKYSQGWFVGWYESPDRTLLFVTYIKAPKDANGIIARMLTLSRLKDMGLWTARVK